MAVKEVMEELERKKHLSARGPKEIASPGDIVLFCVHENPPTWRPLIVVSAEGAAISGELLLDFERDRRCAFSLRLFYALDRGSRHQWVERSEPGAFVGGWRHRGTPAPKFKSALPEPAPAPKPVPPAPEPPTAESARRPLPKVRPIPLERVREGAKK